MGDFKADTAVEGESGRFRARLSRDWEIWGPNGGYLAAIALRAAGTDFPDWRPASFSGHFLSVADFDVVDIEVTRLREAKRALSLRVSMSQDGRGVFEALVWLVREVSGLEHDTSRIPDVPFPNQLRSMEELLSKDELANRFPFWNNLEQRPIEFVHWDQRQLGEPKWCEWYRFRPRAVCGETFADAARALLLIDTLLWPAAHVAHDRDCGFVAPSLDVTAQFFRPVSASEWLLCDAAAPLATDGLIGGQATVWSDDGRLLASGSGALLCRPMARPG